MTYIFLKYNIKRLVETNEEGTEAAAATAIEVWAYTGFPIPVP